MMMAIKIALLCLSFAFYAAGEEIFSGNDNPTTSPLSKEEMARIEYETYRERVDNQTAAFETGLRKFIKNTVKSFLPKLMEYNNEASMSSKCTNSLLKYVSGLTSVKLWAIKMFDSMSKPPAGIFEGTLSDFGAFDQCLDVELPKKNGGVEFYGKYCAIEARPIMPDPPKNFSLAKQIHAHPLDSVGEEIKIAGMAFYYLKLRLGICVPSTCTLQDMQNMFKRISDIAQFDLQVPQCYEKEPTQWKSVHIVVICFLAILLMFCLIGSFIDYKFPKTSSENLDSSKRILKCFSLISNYNRLISSSQGSEELKALHGIKALSIFWVILGHTYVWTNFQLLRRPNIIPKWFNSLDFGVILNGWLGVEPFFFMSGLLTSYAVLKIMKKTKGRINVPIYIIRRYLRLTPPLLLAIGLAFFMPLISSGPFWYERVDPELKSCSQYWWTSILYISNWWEMKNICIHPTWFLSADFQLHVISVVVLYILHRHPRFGLLFIGLIVIICNLVVGILTYSRDLPPIILISSGNNDKIQETLEIVHMRTFTHAGPYYIGIVVGFLMVNHNDIKVPRVVNIIGWGASTALALTSVYGAHNWNIGEPHGPLVSSVFAAFHRTTFTLSIGWVTFVCVTGNGGLVNRLFSSPILTPVSRLTFMTYLLHSLVIWVRKGSLRERMFFSHYNLLYEFVANAVFTLFLTIPFYLLLEAPLSNLERLIFSRLQVKKSEEASNTKENGHFNGNAVHFAQDIMPVKREITKPSVELKAVKSLDGAQDSVLSDKHLC